jgi:hypothetical protein
MLFTVILIPAVPCLNIEVEVRGVSFGISIKIRLQRSLPLRV